MSELVPLGEVCRFIYGESLPEEKRVAGNVPVYGSNGIVGTHNASVTTGPSIVVGRKGSIGRVHYSAVPCYPIDTTYYVELIDKPNSIKWLYYALLALDLTTLNKSAAVPGLNRDDAYEQRLVFPAPEEQERIAGVLEKADRLRQTRRYAQTLSDTFLQSVFLEMFGDPITNPMGWDMEAAGEVLEIKLGKMLDEKRYTGTHLYPYLGNANVQWGRFNLQDLKQMDFDAKDFERFSLRPGDILVCEGGEVGRTAIWRGEVKDCCYQKALHRVRIKKPVMDAFFFAQLMRTGVDLGLLSSVTSSATIAHFTAEKFEELRLILPPIEKQEAFARIVHRYERLRGQQAEATRQAEHLFQSLLAQSFGT